MGDSVQLIHMRQYALDRLSTSSEEKSPKRNGITNGGHVNGDGGQVSPTTPTTPTKMNGFIPNKEYGDWDTSQSPTKDEGAPALVARQQQRSRPSSAKPQQKFIPEHEIEIPADGCLRNFTADDMSTFLRYMGVEERIVTHCHKKGLDGNKFSKLKDSDLEGLGMKNPIICHFRDKSIKEKGGKKKIPFML